MKNYEEEHNGKEELEAVTSIWGDLVTQVQQEEKIEPHGPGNPTLSVEFTVL